MRGFAVFIGILVFLGLALWVEYSPAPSNQSDISAPLIVKPIVKETAPVRNNIIDFQQKIHTEVNLISQIDANPEATEERLKDLSRHLHDTELKALYESSLNHEKSQDERFLSVMLLAWSEKPEAGQLLENIALTESDPYLDSGRNADFESVLRMKAVEGLHDLPLSSKEHQNHLQNIIQKSSNSQVVDRAQRALWASAGEAERPEKQDEKALQEVLEKASR